MGDAHAQSRRRDRDALQRERVAVIASCGKVISSCICAKQHQTQTPRGELKLLSYQREVLGRVTRSLIRYPDTTP